MDHRSVSKHSQLKRRAVERHRLRLQLSDFVNVRGDQITLGSLADIRCAECIDNPMARFLVGDERTDTNDRMVDVLRKLLAEFPSDFVIGFAVVTVGSGEPFQVGCRLDVPNDGSLLRRVAGTTV